MKLETFFEKFDQLADAPNAVEKMRGLVLRMATSGRIAEQNPADPPASELLKEIFAVRDQLIRRGSAKSRVEGNPITAGDTIDLPASWVRCMTSEVCDLQTGATPSRQVTSYFGGDIPWLVSGDINRGEIVECDGRINESGMQNSNCKIIPPNSVLIALNGQGKTRATVALLRIAAALNQSLVAMIPYSCERLLPEYIFWNLRGRYYAIRDITGQDQRRGLNMKLVGQLSLPLPPLPEQKRIVAKVDELMALCDRLEAQQQERETRHAALARASLARFADAPTPANLDFLFHHSYTIDPADLRKTILTLAVQGKLVPQDPNDEPAPAFLDRIAAHKATLARDGTYRGPASIVPIPADEGAFEIPGSWTFVRLGEIVVNRDGERIPVSKEERSTKAKTYDYYGASGVIDKIDAYLFDKPLLLIGEDGANLINRSTPIAFMAQGKYWVNNHAHVLDGISEDCLRYLELHINAIDLAPYVTGSAQPKMNQAKMNSIPIALPPLAEQRRIVAKVDQLMALVDELETQLAASRATATSLLEALVAELTAATT